ncbi:MAG: hypothetical protein R3C17_16070 [Planctomycetaceae bacterium]
MDRMFAVGLFVSLFVALSAVRSFRGLRQLRIWDMRKRFIDKHISVVLCPEVGGRVLEYALDGKNVLYLSGGGEELETGRPSRSSARPFRRRPELVIPPRPVLSFARRRWKLLPTGTHVSESPDDASTGVRLVPRFGSTEKRRNSSCTQTIHNILDKPVEWCHWSRTFAVGRGICLIPLTALESKISEKLCDVRRGTVVNMSPDDPKNSGAGWLP